LEERAQLGDQGIYGKIIIKCNPYMIGRFWLRTETSGGLL
jgi:hypothetical protein